MENASKALIIAGSILLSILIIGLGMYIFGSAGNSTDTTQMDAMQVSTFNGKFNSYKGIQNGTKVSALLDNLIANSRGNNSKTEIPIVQYEKGTGDADEVKATQDTDKLREIKENLENSHRYYVYMAENSNTDLIHAIVICYDKSDDGQTTADGLALQTTPPKADDDKK